MYNSEAAFYVYGEEEFIKTLSDGRALLLNAEAGLVSMSQAYYNLLVRDVEIGEMILMRKAEVNGLTNTQID